MIARTFRKTISRYRLIRPGDKILTAFSGGPDSSALLALLLDLKKEMPIEIIVGHFNHKLRPEADEDEAFARSVARKFRLPFVSRSRNVRLYARRRKMNIEEAARELRYDFLKAAAKKTGATKIAVGHTLNDQAETVLMRMLRGSGLLGLAGISPSPDGVVIRPLIEIERSGIEAFLRRRKIPFRSDETNADRRYLRNRLRHEILPMLEEIQPSAVHRIGLMALLLRDEETFLEKITEEAMMEFIGRTSEGIALDAAALSTAPRALARRAVRSFLGELRGNLRSLTYDDIASILEMKNGDAFTVRKGLVLKREGDWLRPLGRSAESREFSKIWNGKRVLTVPGSGIRLKAVVLERNSGRMPDYDDGKRACLDADKISWPLLVRGRRPGDRYRPLGAPGTKKIKEILRAKRIPASSRDTLPVIESEGGILWIPGLPVSEGHRIGPSTRKVVVIEKLDIPG